MKCKILILILFLILTSSYVYSIDRKYTVPPRIFNPLMEYPTTVEIYIGSNGEFYWKYPGYTMDSWGEKTFEKALKSAKDWLIWKKKKDSMNYTLIDKCDL